MKAKDWLKSAELQLNAAGVATARLDALVLLEDILGVNRALILADPDLNINAENETKLNKLLTLRTQHMPLAYLRGKTEFFGREFIISEAVLEPRPESETMIEQLKSLPDLPKKPHIADVGTGSGALGITAALEIPNSSVELLELDEAALKVAKMNVDLFTLSIEVKKSDLLLASTQSNDILLCNLPYVPDSHQINQAALHEPHLAIFGGGDGLDLYRELFKQVSELSDKPLYILTEAFLAQHSALCKIAECTGYELVNSEDFTQVFRRAASNMLRS